ncbi:TetR/AcrR family transcriptional regulator [Pseudomaricurvus alkylphenolicus]|uniref:TetR/AcrR family transcriptional regulator n=1 Tax=Pseudomaricurvus alkylphenolicus TaxID=1306991 RepID=UPI00141EFA31|nr:TetR/AcrR family transcriptional regulator [Pseudomaricurvus alkylphenolicus]NIB43069.1 TetR/AcrR family transcriptional regulator [Pseudomaricurvus alkylphenolicus]
MVDRYFSNKSLKLGKRERTRSALIDSAIKVIAEKGFESASIKEITQAAGLANGTFYNHFTDRESLASEAAGVAIFEIALEIKEEVKDIEDGLDKVIVSSDKVVDRTINAPTWGKIIIGAWHHLDDFQQDVAQIMRSDLNLAKRQGLTSLPINKLLEYQICSLIVLSISLQLKNGRNKATRLETAEAILRLLGIAPAEAKQRAQKALFG